MPGGESIEERMALEVPFIEYASPINPAIFHRPRASERCMGKKLRLKEKDIGHEHGKGRGQQG